MSPLKDALTPARQNSIQRAGFFSSLALVALILFLHFPFDGYLIDEWVMTRDLSAPSACGKTPPELLFMGRCWEDGERQFRRFSEWESKSPLMPWFGSVVHVIISLTFSLLLGALWLWVFRTQ